MTHSGTNMTSKDEFTHIDSFFGGAYRNRKFSEYLRTVEGFSVGHHHMPPQGYLPQSHVTSTRQSSYQSEPQSLPGHQSQELPLPQRSLPVASQSSNRHSYGTYQEPQDYGTYEAPQPSAPTTAQSHPQNQRSTSGRLTTMPMQHLAVHNISRPYDHRIISSGQQTPVPNQRGAYHNQNNFIGQRPVKYPWNWWQTYKIINDGYAWYLAQRFMLHVLNTLLFFFVIGAAVSGKGGPLILVSIFWGVSLFITARHYYQWWIIPAEERREIIKNDAWTREQKRRAKRGF